MDALKLIKSDHERLADLLEEALDAEESGERADLLHQIRAELMAHERMEETVFYPALRTNAKAKEIVLEGYEEHHVIDMILDELLDVPEELDEWKAKFKVLKENIEHHIEEEEGEMFKIARKVFDEQTLEELGAKMQAAKEASTA
jgi:hemerythrin HHE cation binding domain-containing protein